MGTLDEGGRVEARGGRGSPPTGDDRGLATTFKEMADGFPRSGPPGRYGDPGLFPPDSVMRRVTAERALLLGGGRALMMQLAHPLVAAGVADHSAFDRTPWDRLWGTIGSVLDVVFGDTERAGAAVGRVARIHRDVVGERGGAPYRALDPDLLLWVHATLVDSALVSWERFVGVFPHRARQRYYEEAKTFAAVFGLAADRMPADLESFEAYVRRTIPRLEVTAEARRLAAQVLSPPAPLALGFLIALHRLVTVGLLPEPLRGKFGLEWSPARDRAFLAVAWAVRFGRPLLPSSIRLWPHAGSAALRGVEPFGGPRRTPD